MRSAFEMSNINHSIAQTHPSTLRKGFEPYKRAESARCVGTANQSPLRHLKSCRESEYHTWMELRALLPSRESDCSRLDLFFSDIFDWVGMPTDANNPSLSLVECRCCRVCEAHPCSNSCELQRYTHVGYKRSRLVFPYASKAIRTRLVEMRVILPWEIQPFVRAILKSQGFRGSLDRLSQSDERLLAELFCPMRSTLESFDEYRRDRWHLFLAAQAQEATDEIHILHNMLESFDEYRWYRLPMSLAVQAVKAYNVFHVFQDILESFDEYEWDRWHSFLTARAQKATERTRIAQNILENRQGHWKLEPLAYNNNTDWMGRTGDRNHVRRKSSRHPQNQTIRGMILKNTGTPDCGSQSPVQTVGHDDLWIAHGRSSLRTWRRAAGKNKSWRRVPKSVVPRRTRYVGTRPVLSEPRLQFAKSSLWVPAAFLRSGAKKESQRLGCVVRRPGSEIVRGRARGHCSYIYGPDDDFFMHHERQRTAVTDHDFEPRESGLLADEVNNREPGYAFMRLTWADDVPTKVFGILDRFLPTGPILDTCWRIELYLRNDNFADVYLLSDGSLVHPSVGTGEHLEAHIFLDKYYGKCENYSKRHESRMKRSKDCLDAFYYGSRRVLIMRVEKKSVLFKLRNTEEEFPTLVNRDRYNTQSALRQRGFRGKPSYAAVVGGRRPSTDHEYRPQSTPESRSRLEKELDQIQKARLKKNERQRAKRRSQRERRVAELWPVM